MPGFTFGSAAVTVRAADMPTQPAVVQYALKPLAVELREVPVPDIDDDDVLLQVGAVSVCGSDVHQSRNTQSWPVEVPVVLGHEFGGTVAKVGRAGPRLPRRRPRRQRDGSADLRRVPDVPRRPVQPVPVAQRLRLRDRRRDGAVRPGRRTMPASRSRFAAVRHRVPGGAARRRVQRDVRELRRSVLATRWSSWARPDRPALYADGGALRSESTDRCRAHGRRGAARGGGEARRDPYGRRRTSTISRAIVRDLSPLGADVVCDASGSSRHAGGRASARAAGRSDGQGRMVARSDCRRRQSARASQRPAAGILQPQLRHVGARDPLAGQGPHDARRRSSASARRLPAGARRSTPCTIGA